jgi:hypothetical protein
MHDPLSGPFAFTNSAHHEIRLRSQEQLVALVTKLLSDLENKKHKTEKSILKQYVRNRVAEKDAEWLGFFQQPGRAEQWGIDSTP